MVYYRGLGSPTSKVELGLPLKQPSKQTILPIITEKAKVVGFFPITTTTFTGTERVFALPDGNVPITSVTLPPKNATSFFDEGRVDQYMAAYWPEGPGTLKPYAQTNPTYRTLKPWLGYKEFVTADIPNDLGYYSWWSMPEVHWINHFGRGVFIDSLIYGMDKYPYVAPPAPPNPPVTTPQTLRWACTVNMASFQIDCAFFDFNWITLFKTTFPPDSTQEGWATIPLTLEIVSNPPGGYFKASLVQSQGQVIIPGGGVTYDTVRILRLQDPPANTYEFKFNINATRNGIALSVPATLELTVV
jgi:hypothetical protein